MSWMAKLFETYEQGIKLDLPGDERLMPTSHTLQNAHINIVINGDGSFKRAKVLEKTQIVLPATESSAGRSSGEAPHPLADKVQYVAGDYARFGGLKKNYFNGYKAQLQSWCNSDFNHPKALAVYRYIEKESVVADLVGANICFIDSNGCLLTSWSDEGDKENHTPLLFKVLPKEKGKLDQGNALVCWTVEVEGDTKSDTWKDESLQQSWIEFEASAAGSSALCYVTGEVKPAATNHPAKLRHTGDKAKLISANDSSGFTFRGRFIESSEAADISFEVTQKAHNALRWLVSRQASSRNGDQAVIAWAVSGKPIPELLSDNLPFEFDELEIIESEHEPILTETKLDHGRNLGQSFSLALKQYMAGYRAQLSDTESIVIMAIDSATPGRMAVTYYREFHAKAYLERIEQWHRQFAWHQRVSKEIESTVGKKAKSEVRWLLGSPTPWAILSATYGDIVKSNDTLKKSLYERLIPCIVDGRSIPWDLVDLAISRASNRNNSEHWEWERNLGVACGLYRGFFNRHPDQIKRKDFSMALDTENKSRDYLYGRLLAVAEHIEETAMWVTSEPARSTQASRLMQRFSDHPASTWLTIEKGLAPYHQRLKSKRPSMDAAFKKLLDDIHDGFNAADFNSEKRLSGEYLLGFHCQRKWLRDHKVANGQWLLKIENEVYADIQEGVE
jgi:CRISPR-associated protein Csd1